jgi:hypothetical protein
MPLGAFKAALMGTAGVSTGDVVLLSSQTASNSASIVFTSGIDSTYEEYVFGFYNILLATDGEHFDVNFSTDGGSNYNMTKTTTNFDTTHTEGDGDAGLTYRTARDLGQSTASANIANTVGGGSDEGCAGGMHLFNPAGTVLVKHFISRIQGYGQSSYSREYFAAGYINSTSDIDAVQFASSSGNITSGTIKMWGVK